MTEQIPSSTVSPSSAVAAEGLSGTPSAGTPSAGTPSAGTPSAGTPSARTPSAGTPLAATPMPGDPVLHRIRTASRELDDIASVPLADAARRFEKVHAELQSALSDLDDA